MTDPDQVIGIAVPTFSSSHASKQVYGKLIFEKPNLKWQLVSISDLLVVLPGFPKNQNTPSKNYIHLHFLF